MYVVIESFDGEINVDLCANIESARYKKEEYIKYLDDNGINYITNANENNYFDAEINDMLYTIEIRKTKIYDINIL